MPEPESPLPKEPPQTQPGPSQTDNGEGLAQFFKEVDEQGAAEKTDRA